MLRSALTCLLGSLAIALLISAPAAAARVGCPCKSTHNSYHHRHVHVAEAMPARVRPPARVHVHRHVVPTSHRTVHPRRRYHAIYYHRRPRYQDMAGGGEHIQNAGSLAWRYWGY
jgi:hypothetical protein